MNIYTKNLFLSILVTGLTFNYDAIASNEDTTLLPLDEINTDQQAPETQSQGEAQEPNNNAEPQKQAIDVNLQQNAGANDQTSNLKDSVQQAGTLAQQVEMQQGEEGLPVDQSQVERQQNSEQDQQVQAASEQNNQQAPETPSQGEAQEPNNNAEPQKQAIDVNLQQNAGANDQTSNLKDPVQQAGTLAQQVEMQQGEEGLPVDQSQVEHAKIITQSPQQSNVITAQPIEAEQVKVSPKQNNMDIVNIQNPNNNVEAGIANKSQERIILKIQDRASIGQQPENSPSYINNTVQASPSQKVPNPEQRKTQELKQIADGPETISQTANHGDRQTNNNISIVPQEKNKSQALGDKEKWVWVTANGDVYDQTNFPKEMWIISLPESKLNQISADTSPNKTTEALNIPNTDLETQEQVQKMADIIIDENGDVVELADENGKIIKFTPSTTEDGQILTNNGRTIAIVNKQGEHIKVVPNTIISSMDSAPSSNGPNEAENVSPNTQPSIASQQAQHTKTENQMSYLRLGKAGDLLKSLQNSNPDSEVFVANPVTEK